MIFIYEDILVDMLEVCEEWCNNFVEVVVEVFEELMDKFFFGEELIEEEIKIVLC